MIDDGLVYLFGAEGMLHCVRADDGEPVWKVDTAKRFGVVQNFFGVGSTPVVEGDLLIVMVGGSPPESQDAGTLRPGSRRRQRHGDRGLRQANGRGEVRDHRRTGQLRHAPDWPRSTAAAGASSFARGGLVGFEPRSGKVDFHYPWRSRLRDSVNAATPVVVGDEVFISETYGPGSSLLRVKPGGYEVVWSDPPGRNKAMQTHWNTPIYHEGLSLRLQRAALRRTPSCGASSGRRARSCGASRGCTRASLLYVDGHFVCLSEDGVLRLIKATPEAYVEVAEAVVREEPDGPPLLSPPAWAAPILSHGLLYVRGDDRLVCLRLIPTTKGETPR